MARKDRFCAMAATVVVAVVLNLALVVPVFADNDGYDGDEGGGWLLPIVLIALVLGAGIAGLLYWRNRRSETPQS